MLKLFAYLSKILQKNKKAPSTSKDLEITLGIGSIIDQRYRLDAEIGRGGMGIVYRAHDIPNDRDVAVKVVNLDAANVLTLSQFEREGKITVRLNHPHIVALYEIGVVDLGASGSAPYIVMELVYGQRLDEMRGFTYGRIIDIGAQICDALEYIHEQGFVYRDLKPGNVILEKRGFRYFVKLLDFGLARPRGEASLPNESNLAGTVFYLAPELIAGQPADIGSDLYAFGAMLYEMITGRVPFSNFDEENVISQHLEELAPAPSQMRGDVLPALESIVLRLLEKNPKDRFASAQEVRRVLNQVALTLDSAASGNLPEISTNFSAHGNEIEQVIQMLKSNQLVTIVGNSDLLALAVGAKVTGQFAEGVWIVELGSVVDPMLVMQTVASILGVHADPNRALTVSLIEYLREKNLLLLLNQYDPVLGACSQLVETILRTCPEVSILATSASPFNIAAEKCYRGFVETGA